MAEEKELKKETKKEAPKVVDYTIWHPDFRLNHVYTDKDGKKLYWTLKSMDVEPTLKYVD